MSPAPSTLLLPSFDVRMRRDSQFRCDARSDLCRPRRADAFPARLAAELRPPVFEHLTPRTATTQTPAQMPTSVYRQAEVPLTIEAGPAESVHIPEGGDAELELPENYDDDAYEGYEAMLQLQAEAAASESLALRLGSPRFERPSALSPFAEEAVDEASASPELEAPPPPADSGGASSSLAPVTERSANWRRQLAERSAADAQEEAPPPPAAARGGKRPVDGRRAAAARLGKQIAEKERQKEEAIADAKLAKMNVSLLQQRCEGLVDEVRRMHAAEAAEAREQAARDEKEARRAYAEAERAARTEVEEMMGGFFY